MTHPEPRACINLWYHMNLTPHGYQTTQCTFLPCWAKTAKLFLKNLIITKKTLYFCLKICFILMWAYREMCYIYISACVAQEDCTCFATKWDDINPIPFLYPTERLPNLWPPWVTGLEQRQRLYIVHVLKYTFITVYTSYLLEYTLKCFTHTTHTQESLQ